MRVIEKLKEVTTVLKGSGIESPEKEAEILLRHGLNINTLEMYRDNQEIDEADLMTLKDILNRRLTREPLQYILGYEEFLGLKILLGHGVLIPRPETELLVEQAIKTVASYKLQVIRENKDSSLVTCHSSLRVLDLCTGSGCIALALAKEFPDAQVYGIDISEVALGYAKRNAEINAIKNVVFFKGSLFEPIEKRFTVHGSRFTADLIISNPPYIKTEEIKSLQHEIKDWEPEVALDGGIDGMDFYREIIPTARHFLKNNGIIVFELGDSHAEYAGDIFISSGYTDIKILRDYAGIERIILARWIR